MTSGLNFVIPEIARFRLSSSGNAKTEMICFETSPNYPDGNGLIVLVELGATERSLGRSPTKIYTPLEVISPVVHTNNPGPSASALPHFTAEKSLIPKAPPPEDRVSDADIRDDDSSVIVLHQTCEGIEHHVEQPPSAAHTENTQAQTCDIPPPPPAMDLFPGEIFQELLEGIMAVGSSHMMSSPFSRYILDRSHEEETASPQHHYKLYKRLRSQCCSWIRSAYGTLPSNSWILICAREETKT